ncbi:MAG: redoxin family protein, partial [Paramuribaculum sp.]|nr:redoxin family protein [Paramuribaculum sp.]
TPDVATDSIFDAIIAPHKGKVVMVDLWNTWCGPCRAALEYHEPEKDDALSSEDIVWIYIADESSPVKTYFDMIPGIKGLHYRLNDEQKNAIMDRFKVDGIPYYILVDHKGNASGRPDLRNPNLYKNAIIEALGATVE